MGTHFCSADDCLEPAFRQGLCRGHYEQRYQGKPLTPIEPKASPKQLAIRAALDLADAESDDDYHRAEGRLAYAAKRWKGRR